MNRQGNAAAPRRIPPGVWVLGLVSLLMDVSSEMIHSLLPVFLVSTLGAGAVTVGLIEGMAEATALVVRVFSGTLSDYLGKRKPLAVAGYGLAALSKPLFALAASPGMVFSARLLDRVGKGIRGAPRDALVADITPPAVRGAAYGLRQSLDTVGAFCGPLLAVGLMLAWSNDIRAVFQVAIVPAVVSVLLLSLAVREPQRPRAGGRLNPIHRRELRRLGGRYWWIVAAGVLVTLARFSEAFLVLRAHAGGLPLAWTPLVLIAMNMVYALSAYPFGRLSDGVSHLKLLAAGLAVLIGANLALASGSGLVAIFAGICLWGLHMGMTQGLLSRMIADAAPDDLRGTAFGFFYLAAGLTTLLANVLAGLLWDRLSPASTFYAGAAFCLAGAAVIVVYGRRKSHRFPAG